MATVNIGNLTFTHKGDYASGTAYVKNDVVYYSTNGNAYIAKQNTTGNAPTNATYWNQFAQGSGGIWNAGLSLGTAGQVVKVNSGASALEFGSVSSDYVKLASVSATSGTSVSIDGYFDDTIYAMYKIIAYNYESDANEWWKFQYNTGGANYSSSDYRWAGDYARRTSGSNSHNIDGGYNVNYLPMSWWGSNTSDQPMITEITFTQPQSTSQTKPSFVCTTSNDNGNIVRFDVGGNFDSQTAATGITMYPNSGNISRFDATLYGVKK